MLMLRPGLLAKKINKVIHFNKKKTKYKPKTAVRASIARDKADSLVDMRYCHTQPGSLVVGKCLILAAEYSHQGICVFTSSCFSPGVLAV